MKIDNVELNWLGHAGFMIKNSKVIYIDPYMIRDDLPKADIILITHGHYDHLDTRSLASFERSTHVITPLGYKGLFEDLEMNNRTQLDWFEFHRDGGTRV